MAPQPEAQVVTDPPNHPLRPAPIRGTPAKISTSSSSPMLISNRTVLLSQNNIAPAPAAEDTPLTTRLVQVACRGQRGPLRAHAVQIASSLHRRIAPPRQRTSSSRMGARTLAKHRRPAASSSGSLEHIQSLATSAVQAPRRQTRTQSSCLRFTMARR